MQTLICFNVQAPLALTKTVFIVVFKAKRLMNACFNEGFPYLQDIFEGLCAGGYCVDGKCSSSPEYLPQIGDMYILKP